MSVLCARCLILLPLPSYVLGGTSRSCPRVTAGVRSRGCVAARGAGLGGMQPLNQQPTLVRILRSLFRNNQKCLVSFQQTVQANSFPLPPSRSHIQKEGNLAVHFSEVALLLQGVRALRMRAVKSIAVQATLAQVIATAHSHRQLHFRFVGFVFFFVFVFSLKPLWKVKTISCLARLPSWPSKIVVLKIVRIGTPWYKDTAEPLLCPQLHGHPYERSRCSYNYIFLWINPSKKKKNPGHSAPAWFLNNNN